MKIEKARISDAVQIHQLINYFANRGEMLPRSLGDIYGNIRDYFVFRQDEDVVGCVALHIFWADLAEVRSLAVAEDKQKRGIGEELVQSCVNEARKLGIPLLFCLTYRPGFFEKVGFTPVDRMELPRKVWVECYHCPKFPNCDETALVYPLNTSLTAEKSGQETVTG